MGPAAVYNQFTPSPSQVPSWNIGGPTRRKVTKPVISRVRVGVKIKSIVPLRILWKNFSIFARIKEPAR